MTEDAPDALRIRLEGSLELIESACRSLEELERLLRAHLWPNAAELKGHLQRLNELEPKLPEAQEAARRAGASGASDRLARARAALERSLQKRFKESAIGRAAASERLSLWAQLLETEGAPARVEEPLAEAQATLHRWWWWVVLQALSIGTQVAGQAMLSLGLVFAAVVAFARGGSRVRYRLFHDVLVRECEGEPTLQLPLSSFERGEAMPGTTLRGLMDVKLAAGPGFETFCERLNQLANERETLQLEAIAIEQFAGPPGRWLEASFERQDLSRRQAIGLSMGGLALLSERGLLFIPDSAQAEVRSVLFGTERLQHLREQQRALQTLPAPLILEHLEEVRRIDGVRWCPAGIDLSWTWVDDREEVELMGGRLAVIVNEASRAELRALWPT